MSTALNQSKSLVSADLSDTLKSHEPEKLKLRCKTLISYYPNLGVLDITRLNSDDSIQRVTVYRDYSGHSHERIEQLLSNACWHKADDEINHVDEYGEIECRDVEHYWYQSA